MVTYKLAKIPGDGIGPEIIREGVKVIEKAATINNFSIDWVEYDNEKVEHFSSKRAFYHINRIIRKTEKAGKLRIIVRDNVVVYIRNGKYVFKLIRNKALYS